MERSGVLPVRLGWSIGGGVPAYKYSVALHILNGAGDLVAQADYGLPVTTFTCEPHPFTIVNLPPGVYSLNVIVYAWETGEQLQGVNVATGETGVRLPVGVFRVE